MSGFKFDSLPISALTGRDHRMNYIRDQISMGRSVVVNSVGDSTMGNASYWSADAMRRLGIELNCNVKHSLWDFTTKKYKAWTTLNNAGADRHVRIPPLAGLARVLSHTECPITSDDLDLSINFSLDDWYDGVTNKYILGKWGSAGYRSWAFYLGSNGNFYLYWSENGTDITYNVRFNNVSLQSNTDGAAYWYRVTLDVNDGAGHYVATLYTSTDGFTWTSAQAVTGVAASSIFVSTTTPFTLGALTSTGSADAVGKYYFVYIRDGIDGRVVNPQPIESWRNATSSTYSSVTVGGTPTIYVFNAGVGGATTSTFLTDTPAGQYAPNSYQPVVIISLGYNHGADNGNVYISAIDALATAMKSYTVRPTIFVAAQCPLVSPSIQIVSQDARASDIRGYAVSNNYGLLDLYKIFKTSGVDISTLINADGTHPNATGQALLAASVCDMFAA